jgi:hypothetical protein
MSMIQRWWETEPWQHRDYAPRSSLRSSTRSRGIDEVRMRLSCHEVSHGLRFQEAGAEVDRITVNPGPTPRGLMAACCHIKRPGGDVLDRLEGSLVGIASDKILFNTVWGDGETQDHLDAHELANGIAGVEGRDQAAADQLYADAMREAERWVREHEAVIRHIGARLYKTGELSGVQVAVAANKFRQVPVSDGDVHYRPYEGWLVAASGKLMKSRAMPYLGNVMTRAEADSRFGVEIKN